MADFQTSSPTAYLIRAWHEWMQDNGLTPYLLVKVDERVSVPPAHVQGGEIVLNIGTDATGSLNIGNETISFQARFSGKVHNISVPADCVASIFARETGQGMGFDMYDVTDDDAVFDSSADASSYRPTRQDKPAGLSVVEKTTPETTTNMPADDAASSTNSSDNKEKTGKNDKGGKSSNLRLID